MVAGSTKSSSSIFALSGLIVGVVVGVVTARGQGADEIPAAPAGTESAMSGSGTESDSDSDTERSSGGPASSFSARLARLESLSVVDDASDLESLIRTALGGAYHPTRSSEIEDLFVRLFEVSPERAIDLAQSVTVPDEVLSGIFLKWSVLDVDQVVALTNRVAHAWTRTLLIRAAIDATNGAAVEQLAASAEILNVSTAELQIERLASVARRDPALALRGVNELSGSDIQTIATVQIARVAAMSNPQAALSHAASIQNPVQRIAFVSELYRHWSRIDVSGFLDHLRMRDPNQPGIDSLARGPLAVAAEADPHATLAFADQVGGLLGTVAASAAVDALAAEDPGAALEYLESSGDGLLDKDRLTVLVAQGYARADIDAALSWLGELIPPNRAAERVVMSELAAVDLPRAMDLEFRKFGDATDDDWVPPPWLITPMLSDLDNPGILADRAATLPDSQRKTRLLMTIMSRWADSDPAGAVAWVRSSGGTDGDIVQAVARTLGEDGELDLVVSLAGSFPPQQRASWIQNSIAAAANYNPAQAATVAQQFRGEPIYDALVTNIVATTMMRQGPEVAANYLGDAAPLAAVQIVSTQWGQRDPAAAATWASGLADPETRAQAVSGVLDSWVFLDAEGAAYWARGLPDRSLRDDALAQICSKAPNVASCG